MKIELFFIIGLPIAIVGYLLWHIIKKGFSLETLDEYLCPRSADKAGLDSSKTWKTAVASNFQTASVLVIGIQFGYFYGLTMLCAGVSYALGFYLLLYAGTRLDDASKKRVFSSSELPYTRILGETKKPIQILPNVFIYAALLITAIIELWFGSRFIFDVTSPIFVDNGLPENSIKSIPFIIVFVLSVILLFYVYIGGYSAVVETDKIQLSLIFIMGVILIFTFVNLFWKSDSFSNLLLGTIPIGESPFYFATLLVGAITLNFFWQFVEVQQWQRARAASTASEYLKSLPQTARMILFTWSIPVVIGALVAASGLLAEGVAISLPFQLLYKSSIIPHFATIILISLVIAGVIATVMSTADTVIIAFISRLIKIDRFSETLFEARRKAILVVIVVVREDSLRTSFHAI